MIDKKISELFELSDNSERQMWENAVIVFDSSALLNFYDIPKDSRKEIYKTFRGSLKDRLMLTGHIQFEYLKNRKKTISEPLKNNGKDISYYSIEKHYLMNINKEYKSINSSISEIKKLMNEVNSATKKSDRHPHLPEDIFSSFKIDLDKFSQDINQFDEHRLKFETKIKEHIKSIRNEITDLESKDDVLDAINTYFILGVDHEYSEKLKLANEASKRYLNSIPPGYLDNNKDGLQKYGDFYIWDQIIDYALKNRKSVIFICDDLKDDWCVQEKNNRNRISYPRPELSKEFFEKTGYRFWMYSLSQWPFYSNKYLNTELNVDNFTFQPEYIDTSIVNTIDVAKKYLNLLNEKDYNHNIPPSILNLVLKNLEHFSFSTLRKIQTNLTSQLNLLEKDKRLLQAKKDFEENIADREKIQENLNELDMDIMETYENITYLQSHLEFDDLPF
ncbi:PIN-like domain-containing protein [Salegentibacter mishustinae]|uniref:PIN-like domain-containing protein n=1 Tax=Salegentibacter mishustinae TaxID=270918 RepID=UPI00248FE322|nr:PIN-like domain-containing protein [Salegentibacter mishustinae]